MHLNRALFAVVLTGQAFASMRTGDPSVQPGSPSGLGLSAAMRQSFGLTRTQAPGEIWGGGPDYKALFTGAGFQFTTALGKAVERAPSLTFELESIRRGAELVYSAPGERVPQRLDNSVSYQLAPGLTETFELRREGVEQSYVFGAPIGDSGELVVRGRIQTGYPLPPSGESSDGLRFELPGIGGITYGGVTGIDANGARVAGSLRFDGSHLDLVLPAAFVDSAAWPLVLDPLVGSTIAVSSGFNDTQPDVAYDAGSARYLVVWVRAFSASDWDIRGQLLSSTGSLFQGLISIEIAGDFATGPTVANCNIANKFLVAWVESAGFLIPSDIKCRDVTASNGVLSAEVVLAATTISESAPDAGGEATTLDNQVLVVYWESTNFGLSGLGIKSKVVTLNGAVAPVVGTTTTLSTDPDDSNPAISKSGGSTGKFLIVWERSVFGFPPFGQANADLVRAVVDRNGIIVVAPDVMAGTAADEQNPDCDGDGVEFMLVYEREDAPDSGNNDIACRALQLDGATLIQSAELVLALGGDDDETRPAVGFTGEEYVMAWQDEQSGTVYDIAVIGLDPFTCAICEPIENVDVSTATDDENPSIATQFSGGSTTLDDAMIVWQSVNTSSGNGVVEGFRYQSDSGTSTDLGGGCGGGGKAWATCAITGNLFFRHRLRDATSSTTGFLIMGFEELNLACGTCTLVPDPYSAFVYATGSTDVNGNDSLTMSIPSDAGLIGLTIIDQWAVVDASPACTGVGTDLSNAIRVVIQ